MTLTPKSEEVVTKLLAALQVHPLFEHLATDLMSRKSGTLGNLRLVEPGHGCKVGCNHSCCRIQPYLDLDLCLYLGSDLGLGLEELGMEVELELEKEVADEEAKVKLLRKAGWDKLPASLAALEHFVVVSSQMG